LAAAWTATAAVSTVVEAATAWAAAVSAVAVSVAGAFAAVAEEGGDERSFEEQNK